MAQEEAKGIEEGKHLATCDACEKSRAEERETLNDWSSDDEKR